MNRQAFITRAERILKTDIRYVGKNSFWVVLGEIIIALLGFALSVGFANLISPEEFGVYKYIFAVAGMLAAFRLSGLRQVVANSVSRGYERTVFEAIKLNLRWSLMMLAAGALVSGYYLFKGNEVIAYGVLAVVISNALIGAARIAYGYLAGKKNFRLLTICTSTTTGISILATLTSLFLTNNILTIVLINVATMTVSTLLISRKITSFVRRDTEIDKRGLSFGKHLGLQNGLVYAAGHFDKIVLFQFLGSAELAIYTFAQMLPIQLTGLYKSTLSIIVPKLAEKSHHEMRRAVNKKTLILTFASSIPVFAYILAAPWLFELFFSQYSEAIVLSQLLALSVILVPSGYLIHTYFSVRQATRIMYKWNIAASVFQLLAVVILTYMFGLIGAVFSIIATRIFRVMLLAYFYWKDV